MAELVDTVAGGQRIQVKSGDFSAFDKPVGHAARCRPDGEGRVVIMISSGYAQQSVSLR